MKKLNEDVLEFGDIILCTGTTLLSKSIRTFTNSDISHAMLYVNVCSVIHADGRGVHADNTQRMLFDDNTKVYGLRLKEGLPTVAARAICDYARQVVGTEYSVKEALKVAAPIKVASVKQFCSRLVAQAYSKQGYNLVKNPDFCSPDALLKSKSLQQIPNVIRDVSAYEASFIENTPDIPGQLAKITNDMFAQLRSIDPSVQTFSDLGRLVIKNKDVDFLVRNIMVSSGYLQFKEHDETEYPWRYDIALMQQMPESPELVSYCKNTMKGENRDDNRFTVTLNNVEQNNARWPRLTFQLIISLYKHLARMHALRVDTAETWLRARAARLASNGILGDGS